MNQKLLLSTLLLGAGSLASQGALIHRYSFNDTAGDASGAALTDSVGGADGVVQGAGANFTGSGLSLPGGSSATAAYGDLPNNIISAHTSITIEGWVTIDALDQPWARVFDFGSSNFAEVTGPGGGGSGTDYMFLSASINGTDYQNQRIEVRDEDPGGGGIATFDSGAITAAAQTFHYAVTWSNDGDGTSTINYWRDGVHQTIDGDVGSELGDLNDVNNWLGRSNWTADANLNGSFDEFRIYDHALSGAEVANSLAAGPNTVIPEPSSGLLSLLGLGLLMRVRRR